MNNNKKVKTFAVKTFFAGSIILAILVGIMTFCSGPPISQTRAEKMEQNVSKVKIGMTKQELKNLLGKPDDYAYKIPFLYDHGAMEKAPSWLYLYWDDDFSFRVEFDPQTDRVIKSERVSTGIGFL